MSYILEALRKADAERERGAVPDLHAQALPVRVSDAQVLSPRSSLGLWLGLGVGLAAVAGAAWFFLGRDDAVRIAPAAAPDVAPVVAPVVTTAATPPLAVPALPASPATPAAIAPLVTPVPPLDLPATSVTQTQSAVQPEAPAPAPVGKPQARAPASLPVRPAAAPKVVVPTPKPAMSPPKAEPAAPSARVPALAELPAEFRQQVPALVVGGSVYSPQASARMVVINGQVFQEGSSLAPELKLEQIRHKTAVFSIQGQRFEVPL